MRLKGGRLIEKLRPRHSMRRVTGGAVWPRWIDALRAVGGDVFLQSGRADKTDLPDIIGRRMFVEKDLTIKKCVRTIERLPARLYNKY